MRVSDLVAYSGSVDEDLKKKIKKMMRQIFPVQSSHKMADKQIACSRV